MLHRDHHELLLKQILRDLYKHKRIQGQIAFKGGTCLYIFYDLPRFSTDLDFNLLDTNGFDHNEITGILKKYLQLDEISSKANTWFWLGSYEKGLQKIKVEVSKREYPDEYTNLEFLGILVPTMKPAYMFAHKLCAITDRNRLQNRDIYDTWFMFDKQWEPSEEIIRIRTGKSKMEYFRELVNLLESPKVQKRSILDGLGDVLDSKQKAWVKENLLNEVIFQLKVRSTL